jgi:Fic family protein
MEYAAPIDVPFLMTRWLKDFNGSLDKAKKPAQAISLYTRAHMSFVRIHPFFDGNGRMARLIANLPVLRGGYPPIVIPREMRSKYIDLLWEYQNAVGRIDRISQFLPQNPAISHFELFIKAEWQQTEKLVKEARRLEATRQSRKVATEQ